MSSGEAANPVVTSMNTGGSKFQLSIFIIVYEASGGTSDAHTFTCET